MNATVILVGRLGADPKKRTTQNGAEMTTMSIATNRTRRGEKTTIWHKVLLFGKSGENVYSFLKKGDGCVVTGELDYDTYTRKDGIEVRETVVVGQVVNFGSVFRDGERPAPAAETRAPQPVQSSPKPAQPKSIETFDDIPF